MADLPELFLDRPGGVLLHAFIDEQGDVVVTLQHRPEPGRAMENFGLCIASAEPSACFVDETKAPPCLALGLDCMFPLKPPQAIRARRWLAEVQMSAAASAAKEAPNAPVH